LLFNFGGGVCEVGVYKDGYLIATLKNTSSFNALALDPFSSLDSIKGAFKSDLKLSDLE